jgi:hypothetical protein
VTASLGSEPNATPDQAIATGEPQDRGPERPPVTAMTGFVSEAPSRVDALPPAAGLSGSDACVVPDWVSSAYLYIPGCPCRRG